MPTWLTRLVTLTIIAMSRRAFSSTTKTANAVFLSRFSGLSMDHFCTSLQTLCDTPLSKLKLCYIPTASYVLSETSEKSKGEQRRRMRYEAKSKGQLLIQQMQLDSSIKATLLELDAPTLQSSDVHKALSDSDIVYVDGGNTFYLQYMMLKTNFWGIANPLLESKRLLYMGASAGAIVAAQSIKTAYWKGWDAPIPSGMGMEDWSWSDETLKGRGLVPFSLFMHYDEAAHSSLVENNRASLDHKVMVLPDNCAMLVNSHTGSVSLSANGQSKHLMVIE